MLMFLLCVLFVFPEPLPFPFPSYASPIMPVNRSFAIRHYSRASSTAGTTTGPSSASSRSRRSSTPCTGGSSWSSRRRQSGSAANQQATTAVSPPDALWSSPKLLTLAPSCDGPGRPALRPREAVCQVGEGGCMMDPARCACVPSAPLVTLQHAHIPTVDQPQYPLYLQGHLHPCLSL